METVIAALFVIACLVPFLGMASAFFCFFVLVARHFGGGDPALTRTG